MKNIWRLVSKSTETLPRFSPQISTIRVSVPQVSNPNSQVSNPNSFLIQIPKLRYFSSTSVVDSRLVDIFSKPASLDDKINLDSLDIKLDQELVHSVLKKLETIPESARMFFDWVLEREVKENRVLRSKSYNKMLEIVGMNGDLKEFWDLNNAMEKKGYKISKETYMKVCKRLKNDRMDKDLEMLNKMYSTSSSQIIASRVRGVLSKDDEKFEVICRKLENLGVRFKSDLIADVLDQIGAETKKALVFFKWVEANPKIRIDGRVLNAVARVLGREDCISDFWDTLQKMQDLGQNLERDTYVKVINWFYKRKMINNGVVKLYEFAMNSSEKPPVDDFSFHLRKILMCKELDMSLVTKIVRIYLNSGSSRRIIDKSFDGYLKSLRSVERLGECLNVLKAMQVGGYEPDASVHGKIVVGLSNAKKLDEALDYADKLGRSGLKLDLNTWSSFVQKAYNAGEFDKVSRCFEKMVGIIGSENAKPAFDVLVHELCHKKNAKHASNVFKDTVVRKNIRPWHATYKFLIEKLLNTGNYEEATDLLMLMKEHGFPPFIDPFIVYISKSGTADDAVILLKAIASNEYPSTNVYIQLFEALIKEGRHRVANDLHSMAPSSVHNHEDVLNLLCLKKPDEAAIAAAL